MTEVNENMARALSVDVEEIEKVTKEIISHVGEIHTVSWKSPNMDGGFIDSMALMKDFQGSREARYLYMMELLVDRLHFFFHIHAQFLESFPVSFEKSTACPYVSAPVFKSFSTLIHNIWNVTKAIYQYCLDIKDDDVLNKCLCDSGDVPRVLSISKEISERSSQTPMLSLKHCENCEISVTLIRKIAVKLERCFNSLHSEEDKMNHVLLPESAISALKKDVGHHQITQWNFIIRLATAAEDDLTMLCDAMTKTLNENKSLVQSVRHDEKRVYKLEKELKRLVNSVKEEKNKNLDFTKSKLNLMKSLTEKTEQVKCLSEELLQSRDLNHRLAKENEQFSQQQKKCQIELAKAKEEIDMKNDEIDAYKNKCSSKAKSQQHCSQEDTQAEQGIVGKLEGRLIIASHRHADDHIASAEEERGLPQMKKLQEKLGKEKVDKCTLTEEVLPLHSDNILDENTTLLSKLHKNQKEVLMLAKCPDVNRAREPELTGIPEVDMQKQIEANNLRIKLLHGENAKLVKIISKIKSRLIEPPTSS